MASRPRGVRRGRRALKLALLALLLVVAALLSLSAGAYVAVARTLPALELGDRIASPQTTKIYDVSPTPVLLAELHGLENRDVLPGDQIPQMMRDAIVAIEDSRFYDHKGVDFVAILRAAWANLRHREIVQGGSTITQQLIKNAFMTDEQALDRNVREATLAYRLESRWSKEKILNEYLNIIYFGEGAYGIQAAARTYFGVDAEDLSLAQAALLAGLPERPPRILPDAIQRPRSRGATSCSTKCTSKATSAASSYRRRWQPRCISQTRAPTLGSKCLTGWNWYGSN